MKMPDGQVLLFKADALTINVETKELVLCKDCKYRYDSIFCPMHQEVFLPSMMDDKDPDLPLDDEGWLILDETEDNGYCHKGERNGRRR